MTYPASLRHCGQVRRARIAHARARRFASVIGRTGEVLRGAEAKAATWQEHFSHRDKLEASLRSAGLRPVHVDGV
jgi:hypothetical protein